MLFKAMKLFGSALLDFYDGERTAKIYIIRDDGEKEELPIDFFFRELNSFLTLEKTALNICRGRILDLGAGAGPMTLELQERGFDVTALDISPEACKVMNDRGIKEVHCIDILDFDAEPFDTILILGRGIGMFGNLSQLSFFLSDMHRLVMPGGQIILDSCDVRITEEEKDLTYQKANREAGRYFGEVRIRFEYKGQLGPFFTWLHVDPEMLGELAKKAGWNCKVLERDEEGNYLARLIENL